MEPRDLGKHPQVAAASPGSPAARPARPRRPAYCRPHPAQRTDMLICEGCVATSSSAKSLVSSG
ncbi:MAG: hypothetical protein ACHQCE_18000 [Streptosporangiales bacterium]